MKQRTDKTGTYYIKKIRKKLKQMEYDLESCIEEIDESIEKSEKKRKDRNDPSFEAYESDLKIIREAHEPHIKILKQIIENDSKDIRRYMEKVLTYPERDMDVCSEIEEQLEVIENSIIAKLEELGCEVTKSDNAKSIGEQKLRHSPEYASIVSFLDDQNAFIDGITCCDDYGANHRSIENLEELNNNGFEMLLNLKEQLPIVESEDDCQVHEELEMRIESLQRNLNEKLEELGCESSEDEDCENDD